MPADSAPVLYVMVGLPAAGKTTRARELESEHGALRLTPDEWMIPLFGESDAGGKRDVVEGRLLWVALRTLRLGIPVVLDYGVWGRQERSALRWLAAQVGAQCELIYLPVDPVEQARRIAERAAAAPESTFDITAADLATYRTVFQPPDDDEWTRVVEPPPAGFATWGHWADARWPSAGTIAAEGQT